jgi:hypothetical protein
MAGLPRRVVEQYPDGVGIAAGTGWYWLSAPRYALKPARTGSKPMELKL